MGRTGKARRNELNRKVAKAALKLRRDGLTNQQIADQLGIDIKAVPGRIELGERLIDAGL